MYTYNIYLSTVGSCFVIIQLVLMYNLLTGKTSTAYALAKQYQASVLTIDGIVLEAIISGRTTAGQRAKELCAEASRHFKEEQQKILEGEDDEKKFPGNLSVEAVTAHTQVSGEE